MKTITCSRLPLLASLVLLASAPPAVLHAGPQGTTGTMELATDSKNILVVNGNEEKNTIDAAGRDVTINGNRNQIVLSGECHALTISGNDNNVVLEGVASISLPGNRNQVVWARAVSGESPQVTNLGNGNRVARQPAR